MELLKRTTVALAAVATIGAGIARAELVFINAVTIGGTGLGAVNTVLTIQPPNGQITTEAGCVAFDGTATPQIGTSQLGGVCTGPGGDVKTGNSQTQTRTLAEAGITTGANFALLFNPQEGGGPNNPITLTGLSVSFYNNAGLLLHTAVFNGVPMNFPVTQQGVGNSGFMFQLNATEAGVVQTFIGLNGLAGIHVGMAAAASAADDGPDTFFIFNGPAATAVPEPSSIVLMATGLIGLVGFARRRRA